jgi:hypothetical protein
MYVVLQQETCSVAGPRYANGVDQFNEEISESVRTMKEKAVVMMLEDQSKFQSSFQCHTIRATKLDQRISRAT